MQCLNSLSHGVSEAAQECLFLLTKYISENYEIGITDFTPIEHVFTNLKHRNENELSKTISLWTCLANKYFETFKWLSVKCSLNDELIQLLKNSTVTFSSSMLREIVNIIGRLQAAEYVKFIVYFMPSCINSLFLVVYFASSYINSIFQIFL